MKKTMEGQFEVVKIDQIVKVEEFKNFYESQSDDSENQLKSSLENVFPKFTVLRELFGQL